MICSRQLYILMEKLCVLLSIGTCMTAQNAQNDLNSSTSIFEPLLLLSEWIDCFDCKYLATGVVYIYRLAIVGFSGFSWYVLISSFH